MKKVYTVIICVCIYMLFIIACKENNKPTIEQDFCSNIHRNDSTSLSKELDSLADLVSFGVAPSFILYKIYFFSLDGFGIALSALIMIFGAIRLARFNAQLVGFDKSYFSGVPVPIPAVTVSSFVLYYYNRNLHSSF